MVQEVMDWTRLRGRRGISMYVILGEPGHPAILIPFMNPQSFRVPRRQYQTVPRSTQEHSQSILFTHTQLWTHLTGLSP